MLAKLQRITTIGLFAFAALWATWAARAGHAGWAVCGALLIIGAYALVLAVELALLQLARGEDPTPRATGVELLHAWWGEVRAAPRVFCWRQPFRSGRWPDLLPPDARGRRGLLLVHGFVCNRGIWNRWLRRLHAQRIPFVAVNLEPVFGSIDDYIAPIEAAVRQLEQATGMAPVVVAHSMGGLALRRWWAESGDDNRIHHVVTIGTPHRGTWLARFALTHNARQMRQLSSWLQALGRRESPSRAARFTCFYSHCDNIVFPPVTGTLSGAHNRHLRATAHVQMVDRPEPFGAVLQLLSPRP